MNAISFPPAPVRSLHFEEAPNHGAFSRLAAYPLSVAPSVTTPHLIALVDDDEAIREAMHDLLESVGIESVAFESAEDFLSDPVRSAVRCIVLDINLPGMSGLDLQKILIDAMPAVPILFLTSVDDPRARERAMSCGAGGFLTKPVDSSQLLSGIRRLSARFEP
jgi:FixJ family two-component response regulator